MLIHRLHPFVEITPFRLVLRGVLPLDFQNQVRAGREPNQEVRAELVKNAREDVGDLKSQVVVFRPS